jgi:hypothetical protein
MQMTDRLEVLETRSTRNDLSQDLALTEAAVQGNRPFISWIFRLSREKLAKQFRGAGFSI